MKQIQLGLGNIKDYLIDKIKDKIQPELIRKSQSSKVNKQVEAELISIFYKAVINTDNPEQQLFKVDEALLIYYFNGKHYAQIEKDVLQSAIRDTMISVGIGQTYAYNSHQKIIAEVYLGLCTNDFCRIYSDPNIVIFRNVVLNLDTEDTFMHDINFSTTTVLDFDYDPLKKCERWEEFVNQVLPNKEFRDALQEFCGAMFVDRYKYKIEKACYLLGTGRNGKSVFTEVIKAILGPGNYTVFSPDSLFRGQNQLYSMATISGKIANICDDASSNDFSGGEYKAFVSGAEVQARNPYGKPFIVSKIPLMMLNVNQMPVTRDESTGYHRRTLIIAFNRTITEEEADPELTSKLTTDEAKTGIFNWIMEGRKRFIANGGKFTQYGAVKEIQRKMKADSNNAFRWLAHEGYEPVSEDKATQSIPAQTLYEDYRRFCLENGENNIRSMSSLGRLMKGEGFVCRKFREGIRYFVNRLPEFERDINFDVDDVDDFPF